MDGWALGAAACMLAVVAVPLLLRSRRLKAGGEDVGGEAEAGAPTSDTEVVRRPSSESERAAKQTKKKRAKKASSEAAPPVA